MHLLGERFGDLLLHKCKKVNDACRALQLFDLYVNHHQYELQSNPPLGNVLVSVLSKFGCMTQAYHVFTNLSYREQISWDSLIIGYINNADTLAAFTIYLEMGKESRNPSIPTFSALLKACIASRDLEKGCKLHDHMLSLGLVEGNIFMSSSLIEMYAKCGWVRRGHELLFRLPIRDVVIWTVLIMGYTDNGYGEEAILCFEQIEREGICCDELTLVSILKACVLLGSVARGQEIHTRIVNKGLERGPLVGNSLLDMYAKCGSLVMAQHVFNMLEERNVVSWTALIDGYVENNHIPKALECFDKMHYDGILANAITLMCILKACSALAAKRRGQEIHIMIVKRGLMGDASVGNGLIHMYAKCGMLPEAQNVFEKLVVQTVVACNALMGGYSEHGQPKHVLALFEWMEHGHMVMNEITFVCILKACGDLGASSVGTEVHFRITKMGLERDTHLGSALLDMYAKCDLLDDARVLLNELPEVDVVSWTALIAGCVEHGYVDRALECYREMKYAGVLTNPKALVSILKAYSNIGSIENAREAHCEIIRRGWEGDIVAASTLAHAYAKCGSCEEAKHVFDELPARDEVCWNVVLAAYAQVGESRHVFRLFDAMLEERRRPGLVTFISVLNACSRGGEVGKGERCFAAIEEYDMLPKAEHYACVIDLLGRSGCIDKMIRMLKDIPVLPDKMMWLAMLGACRKWGFVENGRCAFEHAVQLDAQDGSAYICMANIYSEAKLQEEAMRVETMGVENEARLKSGQNATDIPLHCLAFLLE